MEPTSLDLFQKLIALIAVTALTTAPRLASAESANWPDPEDIPRFVQEMTDKHGFDKEMLTTLFGSLKPNAFILKTIAPPTDPGVRSWQRYRARFLDKARIENGVRFWNLHSETLARAEEAFGVPPEIIVAIIGVETEYGRNKGSFSVLDALTSIAFAYPPRRDFFRGELEQFLLLTRENKQAPEAIRGSYAGAIGIPQFMPGSQRRFAVDFDADGRVDLMNSHQDAIGSVGRFLKLHGWVTGQAITETVKGDIAAYAPTLISAGIKPSVQHSDLKTVGVSDNQLPSRTPAALIDLVSPDENTEYWWGFENFYVITRYNRSSFYAMSVVQLAESIKSLKASGKPLSNHTKTNSRGKYRRAG